MAVQPLSPATRLWLGEPLPHQLPDRPQAHPQAYCYLLPQPSQVVVLWGISPSFPGLSPSRGQVTYVLLTRPPLSIYRITTTYTPSDLHVLGTPPAFVLSQDQTLN